MVHRTEIFFKVLSVFIVIVQLGSLDYFAVRIPQEATEATKNNLSAAFDVDVSQNATKKAKTAELSALYWLVPLGVIAWFAWLEAITGIGHYAWNRYSDATDSSGNEAIRLKSAYIAWLFYAVLGLSPPIIYIFHDDAKLLRYDETSENGVKVVIAGTALLFLILVSAHHSSEAFSRRRLSIERIQGGMIWDILDTVELLETLFRLETLGILPGSMRWAMIIFSCINLASPAIALRELKEKWQSGTLGRLRWGNYKMIYIFVNLLLDIAYLIIRSILWFQHGVDISAFIIKNVACIWLNWADLYEFYFGPEKPIQCKKGKPQCNLMIRQSKDQKRLKKHLKKYHHIVSDGSEEAEEVTDGTTQLTDERETPV